jgi:hypothetical protein
MPHEVEVVKDVLCCCLEPGSVSAKLTVNRRCFVPGETIVMSSVIKNDSYDKRVENDTTRVSLQQVSEWVRACVRACALVRTYTISLNSQLFSFWSLWVRSGTAL